MPGDVVASDDDLVKLHGRGKFSACPEPEVVYVEVPAPAPAPAPEPTPEPVVEAPAEEPVAEEATPKAKKAK